MAIELENGDYLEVHFKDFIRTKIPSYEKIWGNFIGNDGNANMLPAEQLSESEQQKRISLSEHLYTCLESLICMKYICEEKHVIEIENPNEYLAMLNSFLAFQAHSGRLKDNTMKLLSLYFTPEKTNLLTTRLVDFYTQRNNILHGRKIPCQIVDKLALIAEPEGHEANSRKWNDKSSWSDISQDDHVFLTDYINDSFKEICDIFNGILFNLLEIINKIVNINEIDLKLPDNYKHNNFSSSGSASSSACGFSGSSGHAGNKQPIRIKNIRHK